MATTFYTEFFSMSFFHNYYESGMSPDFDVEPGTDAVRFMQRQRMVFTQPGGDESDSFQVRYQSDTAGGPPRIPLPDKLRMTFFAKLRDKHFLNITNFPTKTNRQVYYFENLEFFPLSAPPAPPTRSIPLVLDLHPKTFVHTFSKPGAATLANPATVEVRDTLDATVLYTYQVVPDANDDYRLELDLSDLEEGMYRLVHTDPGYGVLNKRFVIRTNAYYEPNDIVIEVRRQLGNPPYDWTLSPGPRWLLQFRRRRVIWKYWIILKGTGTYAFVDEAAGAVTPYPFPLYISDADHATTVYTKTSEDLDTEAYLQERFPDATIKLYVSTEAIEGTASNDTVDIPYYEIPKQSLALMDSDLTDSRLYSHLPNPQRKRIKPEVFLCLVDQPGSF